MKLKNWEIALIASGCVGAAILAVGMFLGLPQRLAHAAERLSPIHSASYNEGRAWARNWYSDPDRFAYARNSMSHGGTAAFGCRIAVNMMAKPASQDDWITGCIDGTHDMGLEP
jgi:hypothetical protein